MIYKAKVITNAKKRKQCDSLERTGVDHVECAYLQSTSNSSPVQGMISDKRCKFSQEEHRAFVSAVFDIGLKESSPLCVMNHMSKKSKDVHKGLNLERIKSKLQKYRKKKEVNKDEFMGLYDDTLAHFCSIVPQGEDGHNLKYFLPSIESLSSSEIAAYLTRCVMSEKLLSGTKKNTYVAPVNQDLTPTKSNKKKQVNKGSSHNNDVLPVCAGDKNKNSNVDSRLSIPVLTEAERNSPIGRGFVYFMKLFKSIETELYIARSDAERKQAIEQEKLPSQDQGLAKTCTQICHFEESQQLQKLEQSVTKSSSDNVAFGSCESSGRIFRSSLAEATVPSSNSLSSLQSHSFSSNTQQIDEQGIESTQLTTEYLPHMSYNYNNYMQTMMGQQLPAQYYSQHQHLYEP